MKKKEDVNFFSDYKKLYPNAKIEIVHINKRIIDGYYWHWSSDKKDWIRGEKVKKQKNDENTKTDKTAKKRNCGKFSYLYRFSQFSLKSNT